MDVQPAKAVEPLPIGSGGSNATKQKMNELNTVMTGLMAKAGADQKYDPTPPPPASPERIKEHFVGYCPYHRASTVFYVLGGAMIVYGLLSK